MALSMQEKQHVGKEVALRYLRARKKEKGVMLQEFCATTGYSPPYAAYLLRRYAKRVILGAVTLVPTRPSSLHVARLPAGRLPFLTMTMSHLRDSCRVNLRNVREPSG